MDSLLPGRNLHPRFKLVRRLEAHAPVRPQAGEAEGLAWLVRDEELDELLVAKIVPPETPADRVALLKQACKDAKKLVHPNIVPVYDFHRGDEVSFVTMAPVEGRDVSALAGRPLDEILRALIPVADALEYAHRQGVAHGGLRPSSVILDDRGTPRIADFAVAALLPGGTGSRKPTLADDVRAFGFLLFRLVTGRDYRDDGFPPSMPDGLRGLLSAMLEPDGGPPPSVAEVRLKLAALREKAPRPLKVTPPPVVPAPGFIPSSSSPTETRGGGLGPWTIAAFALLSLTAFAVFALLPRWVEQRSAPAAAVPAASASSDPPAAEDTETPDLRALAEEKTKAEEAQARASRLRDGLESRSVARWGGDDYAFAVERLHSGERKLAARDYSGGLTELEAAAQSFEKLETRARTVLAETLAKAKDALASGRSAEASELFRLALEVAPGDGEAKSGLERASHLDEVLALLASGEERERNGDLTGASEKYRRAASLDPLSTTAQRALARVDARASDEAFTAAMTEAVASLGRKDYASARTAFERARAIRPQSPEAANGLSQVAEGLRVEAIAGYRDRAGVLEAEEDWHGAEAEYERALALDPALRFAQEGKTRTAARALLEDKLDFQIGHPGRLSDENALKEAALLLDEARAVEPSGPKHAEKVSKLEALVSAFSEAVAVEILSDRLTEVTISHVGKLGKFDRRALELRPGRYLVVGTREGYRDVRQELVVETGTGKGKRKPPQAVLVRCEEKI